jgi:hypothetical protein
MNDRVVHPRFAPDKIADQHGHRLLSLEILGNPLTIRCAQIEQWTLLGLEDDHLRTCFREAVQHVRSKIAKIYDVIAILPMEASAYWVENTIGP